MEEFIKEGSRVLSLNLDESEGITDLRFMFCDAGQDRMKIVSVSCSKDGSPSCRIVVCVSEFGIQSSRVPGSFFGLLAPTVILDTIELNTTNRAMNLMF